MAADSRQAAAMPSDPLGNEVHRVTGPFGDLGYPVLETERLLLRPLEIGDAARLVSFASDSDLAYRTSAIPHPFRVDDAYQWIRESRAEAATGEAVSFAVARKPDRSLIGTITLYVDSATAGSVGFWIGRPYWNRGYGTESLRAVIHHGFINLGLVEIFADALADNAASLRSQSKAGMVVVETIDRPFRDGAVPITRSCIRRVIAPKA